MKVINTYVPNVASVTREIEFMAVLTQDDAGQFAVYIGLVWSDSTTKAEWVTAYGSKQTWKQAKHYYPALIESQYCS